MSRPRVRPLDDETWEAWVARHPQATLFHTRRWGRVVHRGFPGVIDRSVALETDGAVRLFPLFAWRRCRGLLTTLHASFPFVYGGALTFDAEGTPRPEESLAASVALLEQHAGSEVSLVLHGNPFGARGRAPGDAPPAGFDVRVDSTHVLRLPATEEAYWASLPTGRRNDVRRLGRQGVEIEETRSEAAVSAVVALYEASFARWGGRPRFVYPPTYYRALLSEIGGDARLAVARSEGRVVGGAFTVRSHGIAHYIAGYFDEGAKRLRPNVLLQIDSIQQALRAGCTRYDFLPSGGHTGVEEFKAGLGGEPVPFAVWSRRGRRHRLVDRLLRRG